MIRTEEGNDPFLPRPFTMYRKRLWEAGAPLRQEGMEIFFQVVGRGTRILSTMKSGQRIHLWGPLGRGWDWTQDTRAVLVGGGIGVASLVSLAEAMAETPGGGALALLGARTPDRLWGVDAFRDCGVPVLTAVERGDHPFQGTVLDLLKEQRDTLVGERVGLFVCGPAAMLRAVALWALDSGVECQVSLESPMACGVGVCLGCAVKRSAGPGYLRVCTEGPVLDAKEIDWGAWD